ncbi:MAG: ABC transporter permease [Candidatus Heimdallarchaeota archaeon]
MTSITPPPEPLSIEPVELGSKEDKKIRRGKRNFGLSPLIGKTFKEMLSWKRVVPFFLLSFIFPFIFSIVVAGDMTYILADMSIDFQISTVVSYFAFFSFFWNSGILIWLFGGLTAATFISGEENNGTLVFLLTKPIRRSTVFFGKLLGFFLNLALLEFFSLVLSLTTICTIFQASMTVFLWGLYYMIPIFIYTLLMILIVGIILGLLSIINKRMVVSVLISTMLIFVIYFMGVVFRLAVSTLYADWKLYIIDIGYNFGNMFMIILEPFGFQATPFFQQNFGMFFGYFEASLANLGDSIIAMDPENGLSFILPETNYISAIYSFFVIIAITVGSLFLSIFLVERKDVSG